MPKLRKLRYLEKQRKHTLSVCLPHVIKDKKDVEDLFVGDFRVKLPRQSSRSCHVVFTNVEEKIKNQKLAKNKTVNGKRILVHALSKIVVAEKNRIRKHKKIYMPKIKPDIKVTQRIFVANIEIGTNVDEVKGALSGCVSVILLKPYNKKFRSAIVKMENYEVATEYLKKERKWPILRGHKLFLKPDTRMKHKKKAPIKSLKIYDGTTEESVKEECESSEKHKSSDCTESNNESS